MCGEGSISINEIIRLLDLMGKPDIIAERVREYTAAGVDQSLLAFQDPLDLRALELFVDSLK